MVRRRGRQKGPGRSSTGNLGLLLAAQGPARMGDLPHRVLDRLLEGCQVISPELRYLYVNDAVVAQAKMTRGALLGRTMMECFPGIDGTPMFSTLRRCLQDGTPAVMENEFTFPNGSKGWFELRFEPVPEGAVILSVDITERKRAEAALRRTMQALSTLSRCNQTLVRATDETQFLREVCQLLVESGAYSLAEVRLLGLEVEVRSVQKKRSESDVHDGSGDCRSFHIRVRGEIVGSLKICSAEVGAFGPDETVRLEEIALDLGLGVETLRGRAAHGKLERQLVASQRLEAVGRLAGGVAHDFNNSLAVVLTYSGFARDSLHPSDPACADLEEISRAAEHAAGLTRQLLAFSRKQMLEPKVINLNDIVAGVENMLRRLLGEDILIFVHLDPRLGNVLADAEQLEQVIMNLVVNARDAMPSGGRLAIETDNVILDGEYEEEHASVEPGRYVRLSVTDTGLGMDAETRRRIFEPFFTTKERGSGSGLGLATVYGIVKQSGGNIWVYSEPGQGSTFRIYLPRVDAVAAERKPEAKSEPMVGSEVILLVEDEPCVRRAAERILVSCGYRVCSAGDGESALRLSREFEGPVDLLLTDVVMPKMSGRQLAERLKKERPDIKVLYMSGYTNNTIAQHGALQVGTHFVSKPFAAAELTRKVRQALDEPTDSCEPSA